MSPRHRLFAAAALLGLPALACGYAFTAIMPDGTFQQNQASGRPIVWNVPHQSFTFNFTPSNGLDFNASAQAAMAEWNGVNTPLQYQLGTNGAKTCASDGTNSAGWGTATCLNQPFGDALAVTRRNYTKIGDTWYLSEADIVLNQSQNWQIYSGGLRPGVQDFHRVILHELGHGLGLDHPDDAGERVTAIMNSHTSDIDTLQADDKNGVGALYSGGGSSTSANQTAGGGGGGGAGLTMALLALAALAMRRARAGAM